MHEPGTGRRNTPVAISRTICSVADRSNRSGQRSLSPASFLPNIAELIETPEERARSHRGCGTYEPVPGIVHRHPDRVLFKAVASCPVYCRFCFRREQIGPGKPNALSPDDAERAFAYIENHPETLGGDPDRRRSVHSFRPALRAEGLPAGIAEMGHVKIIRPMAYPRPDGGSRPGEAMILLPHCWRQESRPGVCHPCQSSKGVFTGSEAGAGATG